MTVKGISFDKRHSVEKRCPECDSELTLHARTRKYFCPKFSCPNYMKTIEASK